MTTADRITLVECRRYRAEALAWQERAERAEALLAALVAKAPTIAVDDDDDAGCLYCHGGWEFRLVENDYRPKHASSCPWAHARAWRDERKGE